MSYTFEVHDSTALAFAVVNKALQTLGFPDPMKDLRKVVARDVKELGNNPKYTAVTFEFWVGGISNNTFAMETRLAWSLTAGWLLERGLVWKSQVELAVFRPEVPTRQDKEIKLIGSGLYWNMVHGHEPTTEEIQQVADQLYLGWRNQEDYWSTGVWSPDRPRGDRLSIFGCEQMALTYILLTDPFGTRGRHKCHLDICPTCGGGWDGNGNCANNCDLEPEA